jgi:hypothetical protein
MANDALERHPSIPTRRVRETVTGVARFAEVYGPTDAAA